MIGTQTLAPPRALIAATISRVLARINAISAGRPGWTRPSYSALESEAHAVIEAEARAIGCAVRRDAAGNLFATLPGRDRGARPLYIGSHLDTVSQGGAYDGQAGVVGALAVLGAFHATGQVPPMDLVLTVTRAEESVWFPVSYAGARAALGRLSPEDYAAPRSDTGLSLADHMAQEGFDPKAVRALTPPAPARFVEFHIEQGPVLHEAGEAYAVVDRVRGGLRYRNASVQGTWAHSGGAPRASRADAVVALARLILAMDEVWQRMLTAGHDLTVTFGRLDAASAQHAMAKVPGQAAFCLDLRSDQTATLESANAVLMQEIARIEANSPGIRFDLGAQSRSAPAALSSEMARFICVGAAAQGDAPRVMLSGGGHDAAAFGAAGWDSVMVFIRNWNGSHCPEEAMDEADLARAVGAVFLAIQHEGAA